MSPVTEAITAMMAVVAVMTMTIRLQSVDHNDCDADKMF